MRFAAFDLETAKVLPENVADLKRYAPLGICCAAIALSDKDDVTVWHGVPQLSPDECQSIVHKLRALVDEGYTILTWNGCSFDFFVLGQESGLLDECSALALTHVDLMMYVTFSKGFYLGLDKALQGAGLVGKAKSVTLTDGTVVTDMGGAKVPQMWADGQHDAVLTYLRADVVKLIELARALETSRAMRWVSNSGRPQSVPVPRFLTVRECLRLPEPDTSWMDNPPKRADFTSWMPSTKAKGAKSVRGCLLTTIVTVAVAFGCAVLAFLLDSAVTATPRGEAGPIFSAVIWLSLIAVPLVILNRLTPNARVWRPLRSVLKKLRRRLGRSDKRV